MLIGSDEPSGLPASSAGYTRAVLMIYDLWVTHFSNRYVWRCSVEIHRDHYRKWIGKRHLEVGVGTGYYLSGATLREVQHVALLDPNPLCLAAAKWRIGSVSCTTYCRDALLPISIPEEPFDSIAVSYLLHCLPGPSATRQSFLRISRPCCPTLASSSEAPSSARRWTIIGWADNSCGSITVKAFLTTKTTGLKI